MSHDDVADSPVRLTFRRAHEIKLGQGAAPTPEELEPLAAAKAHVAAQLAPVAPAFSEITERLRASLAAVAPVIAEIATHTRSLDDALAARVRNVQPPLTAARRRGRSRERHAQSGTSVSSRSRRSSDPPRPQPPAKGGTVDDGPGKYRVRSHDELEQLYHDRDEREASRRVTRIFEISSFGIGRPFHGDRRWSDSTLMREGLLDQPEPWQRPLVDQRPTCSRCNRRISRRHLSPGRAWCRPCEAERQRDYYAARKARAA